MPLETKWTLTFLIGTPILAVVLLALLALVVWGFHGWNSGYDADLNRVAAIGGLIAVVVLLGVSALGYYPYKAEYHQWRTVSGKVTEVNKRLIAQDKSMSERYVLVIGGQPYGVDDTRASLVKVGDDVTLSCKLDWQYAAAPGYVCRWVA